MKSINPENFKVVDTISLANRPTNLFRGSDDKENKLDKFRKISELQDVMYAQSLWCFDLFAGMDTSGKDSLILRSLIKGVEVYSFKTLTRLS
jgi:hypothetical protein